MSVIVQKFGGTSVADMDRIRSVADRVESAVKDGHKVTVVVSAMAGVTNQLVEWVREAANGNIDAGHDCEYDCEYDSVVSTGEQVTSGLLACVLQGRGIKARSWLGWQLPVHTEGLHSRARITAIETEKLVSGLDACEVQVVAGFQGIDDDGRIATLGRGGSDITAVALAAALGADRCDIFTDVDGVYTTDPRIVPKARKLDKITYEEMLEMASLGAKVLHTRSVELAMKHNVCLQVLSSFSDAPGTLVVDEEDMLEQELVSGITYSRDEAKVTLVQVPDRPGVAASIFGPLADAEVNVDMIVQNVSEDGNATDLTFTVAQGDIDAAIAVLESKKDDLGYGALVPDPNVVKISVIGVGMRSHAGVAQKMFQIMAEKGINIQVISTSEIKISILVAEEYTELAVRSLHTAYNLDQD
ncbi:MAG: aspartate kinase [Rhodospirillales bacterium]|jgi:aspartate kinase|nr:aspartate kinase [Rhodospirillales bacterium]MBT4006564.1 aspartate kinase [Rhodospirillales bacterium]MBT5077087.1 aspartate kinase [Rhodospirillales bacterium]MBT5113842.1 aspartate kinase [Rhodospirillales bacterium]MBT5672370.1 aspartate kinase [Rhodospirillales bacterium]